MKLPVLLTRNKPLVCGTCHGARRVETRKAVVGQGWKVIGKKCHNCNGRGSLPRR